jgi:hypothetical protein
LQSQPSAIMVLAEIDKKKALGAGRLALEAGS